MDVTEDAAREKGVEDDKLEAYKSEVLPLLYHIDITHTLHEVGIMYIERANESARIRLCMFHET